MIEQDVYGFPKQPLDRLVEGLIRVLNIQLEAFHSSLYGPWYMSVPPRSAVGPPLEVVLLPDGADEDHGVFEPDVRGCWFQLSVNAEPKELSRVREILSVASLGARLIGETRQGVSRSFPTWDYMVRARQLLLEASQRMGPNRLPHPDGLCGCTKKEIDVLRDHVGGLINPAFREFLEWLGHGASSFVHASKWMYRDLFGLRRAARHQLLQGSSPESLPDDALVFYMNPGDSFLYVRTTEADDPPVYEHTESARKTVVVFEYFSSWVEAVLEERIRRIEERFSA